MARDRARADIRILVEAMRRTYGRPPILYAPADLYGEVLEGALPDAPLWVRSLNAAPPALYGARDWQVWQYSETGHVPGIRGPVDRDCIEAARAGHALGLAAAPR